MTKLYVVDLMERLTLEQYRKMVSKVIEFKKLNGEMPKFTTIDGCRISKDEYTDMIEMVNKFLLEMGRNPETVEIGKLEKNGFNKMGKVLAH
jgi:hypothetical protein